MIYFLNNGFLLTITMFSCFEVMIMDIASVGQSTSTIKKCYVTQLKCNST